VSARTRPDRPAVPYLRPLIAWSFAVILLMPVYWMGVTIISPTSAILSRRPHLVPSLEAIDLSAFVRIFTERPVLSWLGNSVTVTIVAIVVTLLAALPAGYAISRASGFLRDLVGYILLVSLVLPATLIVIPIFQVYGMLGLLDNPIAVGFAVASTTVPFSAWMMKTYFDSIPLDLEEAAAVDGVGRFRIFMSVILPISGPGIGAVLAFTSIWAWADFLYASTLLLRDSSWTLTIGIVTFIGEYAADWQGLMATGLIATIPLLLIFLALQRLLVEGLTGGAVKD
jgi:ABC-type glycerol-3-phosphate transport system permease component